MEYRRGCQFIFNQMEGRLLLVAPIPLALVLLVVCEHRRFVGLLTHTLLVVAAEALDLLEFPFFNESGKIDDGLDLRVLHRKSFWANHVPETQKRVSEKLALFFFSLCRRN